MTGRSDDERGNISLFIYRNKVDIVNRNTGIPNACAGLIIQRFILRKGEYSFSLDALWD